MGGRSWWYLTEYQEDAGAALQALRRQVFAAGAYRFDGASPRSIDALVDAAAEVGTGSILDIEGVAARPDTAVAVPAPGRLLQQVFGTQRPSVEAVMASAQQLSDTVPRWRCVYFAAWEDGRPVRWCFAGASGDGERGSSAREGARLVPWRREVEVETTPSVLRMLRLGLGRKSA